jgi:hypothetical protein
MDASPQKITGFRKMCKFGTIIFMLLLIIALVFMPYRFHISSGSFGISAAFAKGGGDDGGGSSGGDSGGVSGDSGGVSGDDGGVSGDDSGGGDHGDDSGSGNHDIDSGGDDGSGHEGGEHHGAAGESDTGSGHGDSSSNGPGALIGVGGLQGLSPVSAEEEAGLVGNWGGSSDSQR